MQRELISTGRRRPRTSVPFPPHRRGHILLMSLLVVAAQAPLGRALVTVAGGSGSQKRVPVPLTFLPSAFKLPGGDPRVHHGSEQTGRRCIKDFNSRTWVAQKPCGSGAGPALLDYSWPLA